MTAPVPPPTAVRLVHIGARSRRNGLCGQAMDRNLAGQFATCRDCWELYHAGQR